MTRYPRWILAALVISVAAPLAAAEVKIFRTDTREAVLAGKLDALSVDPLGALELARRVERLALLQEPFVFAAAPHPDGWVLGTGNSGKVLLVYHGGRVDELFTAAEPEVFAVHVGRDGAVYAATSPHGKVYRLQDGRGDVVFDPADAYVWGLAEDAEGRLLVATGLAGRLYRVDPGGDGAADVLYESADSHVRAVTALADGRVLLGTAGQGLVLELVDGPEKGTVAVATLYDAVQPEVLAIAAAADGTAYAVALASEASRVDLSTTQAPIQGAEAAAGGEGQVTVIAAAGQETMGSRGSGYSGPRSLVLRIRPDGRVDELASLQDETVHSLLWHDGALWIGTGEEGRLYRWAGERLVLERDLEERQITALVAGAGGAAAVTTNGAALYQVPGGRVPEGKYTSAVLDAGQVAQFGSFLWEGELPPGAGLALEARSGMSSAPDATWTPWRRASPNGSGSPRELALGELAEGRFVQYRATLRGDAGGPRVMTSELSYRQRNLKPQIDKLEVLAPGEILVPTNFNAQNQAFEPWSPNREGIFTSLRPEKESDGTRAKTLWKKGYRSLRWTVTDANEDKLVYVLDFRRDAGDGGDWLPIVDELEEAHYSFDATMLPDGVYRFRLTASDEPAQSSGAGLSAEKVSEPVTIDHTPPELVAVERVGGETRAELRDALNPLRDAVYSVNAQPWESAHAADGLLDGRHETVVLEVPEGARMLLLRVTDAAHNVVTFDLLSRKSP